jgi:hypothetical protein
MLCFLAVVVKLGLRQGVALGSEELGMMGSGLFE